MSASQRATVLSGFAGLGGLDLGLEAAGFAHVGCIELDETARRSLKANRGSSWPLLEPGDILEVAQTLCPANLGLDRGELTLLAGAPPCQPFSKAALWSSRSRAGLSDSRADGLEGFLALIEAFLPAAVLIENVTAFAHGTISALPTITQRLDLINSRWGTRYRADWRVLDAASFGVPQHRRRAIIVALRDGRHFHWPRATHDRAPIRAWDAIGGIAVACPPVASGKWAGLLPSIPEGMNYLWHTPRGGGRPLFGYRTRYWTFLLKLAKDLPSWTLSAHPGPSTGPFHWDNRPLAVEELLRLQSLPATWIVEGDYREQVRQVGNATPSLLAEVLGRTVRSTLGMPVPPEPLRLAIARRPHVPSPNPPSQVPRRYLSLEGAHPDHPGKGRGPSPRPHTTR